MTILELEQRTQLERATIRYYEREGLIHPSRKENSYRDYSESDAEEILKIKLLRQLDLPIESIRKLQQGSESMTDMLRRHAAQLTQEAEQTKRAAALCREISESQTGYQVLDAKLYLNRLDTPQEDNTPAPKAASLDAYREYHPWRRFIARMLDYCLTIGMIQFIVIVVLRIRPFDNLVSALVRYGSLVLAIPVQAVFLHYLGTTPGKWIMGIRLQGYGGRKLDIYNAVLREAQALLYGYGLGLPFVRLWRLYKSYKDYGNREILEQDVGVDHIYEYWEMFWNVWKKTIFTLICVFLLFINCFNSIYTLKPRYLSDNLTIANFAENYNYYAKMMNLSDRLNQDGTWFSNGDVVIYGINEPENPDETLRFEVAGEQVKRIHYSNSWTEISLFYPFKTEFYLAGVTAIGSDKGNNPLNIITFLQDFESHSKEESGELTYGNVTIRWNIESENCFFSTNGSYFESDDEKESRVTVNFEILFE